MEISTLNNQLKQARMVFFINLIVTVFSFIIFIRSINSHEAWRIACSGVGFSFFLALTIMVFLSVRKLQKASSL